MQSINNPIIVGRKIIDLKAASRFNGHDAVLCILHVKDPSNNSVERPNVFSSLIQAAAGGKVEWV